MKQFFIFFLTLCALNAEPIVWAKNYDEAKKIAQQQKKKLMVVVTTQVCPWCHKFKTETLTHDTISSKVNKGFVAVNVDRDTGKFPRAFKARLVPTTFFIDPVTEKQLTVTPAIGFWPAHEFDDFLNEAASKK